MKKTFCDVTKDPNILEFVSMFAEQHDVMISFTILGSSGCDVYMGKDGNHGSRRHGISAESFTNET